MNASTQWVRYMRRYSLDQPSFQPYSRRAPKFFQHKDSIFSMDARRSHTCSDVFLRRSSRLPYNRAGGRGCCEKYRRRREMVASSRRQRVGISISPSSPTDPPIDSVDAQWMTAKKDWEELKRKHKARERSAKEDAEPTRAASDGGEAPPEGTYDKNMDAMRCILYLHGGTIAAHPILMVSSDTNINFRWLLLRERGSRAV